MPTYTTLEGVSFEHPSPTGKLREIVRTLRDLLDDPTATVEQMVEVAYSDENPLLGPSIVPGRGAITRSTLSHPIHRLIDDLITRKVFQEQEIDVEAESAKYDVPILEAAERLGCHQNTLRKAIREGRLPVWVHNGQYFLSKRGLEKFRLFRLSDVGTRATREE